MHRWLLLILVLVMVAISSLTLVQSPTWTAWQLAVLAGEFGHWLAIGSILTGMIAWWRRGDDRALGGVTLVLSFVGAVLFLKPAFQAWRMAATLPEKLSAQFPDGRATHRAFSFAELFLGRNPKAVPVQTMNVATGLPLDFYRPAGSPGESGVPCVIVVHGGGWENGDRHQIPELNRWLAQRGYAVAALSYRLAPKFIWPAQHEDVLAAITFLKSRATELGIDSTRLVLLGRSAGGQIALATGYTAGDPAIRGVVALYAPSDLIFGYVNTYENDMLKSPALMRQYLGGTPQSARANYESASALFHVGPRTPATLLLHGENDALVWHRHSVRLDARLADQRIPHVFVSLPWATHGFEYNLRGPGGQLTTFALEWFLASVTK